MVKMTESEFSAAGRPRRVKNPGEKLFTPLAQSSKAKSKCRGDALQPKFRGGTLHSPECHPGTSHHMGQNIKFWPGESISLRTIMPMVSIQNLLPILGAPQPKIKNRCFWLSYDQMVLFTDVRPKPGFGPLEVRPWVKFTKFWPGEISDFTPMVPKVTLQDFLPFLGALRLKVGTIWKFHPFGRTSVRKTPWHVAPDGSKYKILTRREYFASNHYANGLPPEFFTHFGRPTAEN